MSAGKVVQEPCEAQVSEEGRKVLSVKWRNRTYRVTTEIDAFRADG
ncbi:hypothetical protein [Deinococcus hohokamensis]|uniref:Uncharacterized protein n=1 Tax=Deinococcus hohokamensis TaxID=309883 RepID=A0ABV9I8B6_9DEIO